LRGTDERPDSGYMIEPAPGPRSGRRWLSGSVQRQRRQHYPYPPRDRRRPMRFGGRPLFATVRSSRRTALGFHRSAG